MYQINKYQITIFFVRKDFAISTVFNPINRINRSNDNNIWIFVIVSSSLPFFEYKMKIDLFVEEVWKGYGIFWTFRNSLEYINLYKFNPQLQDISSRKIQKYLKLNEVWEFSSFANNTRRLFYVISSWNNKIINVLSTKSIKSLISVEIKERNNQR